jgi:hypothetical protein
LWYANKKSGQHTQQQHTTIDRTFLQFNYKIINSTDINARQLAKKHLTYFWVGRSCPQFIDTQNIFGFKIKCKGCLITDRIKRHNEKVIKKINQIYGDSWFEKNKNKFY